MVSHLSLILGRGLQSFVFLITLFGESYKFAIIKILGRLAQLVERYIDVVDVRGSNPLSSTRLIKVFIYMKKIILLIILILIIISGSYFYKYKNTLIGKSYTTPIISTSSPTSSGINNTVATTSNQNNQDQSGFAFIAVCEGNCKFIVDKIQIYIYDISQQKIIKNKIIVSDDQPAFGDVKYNPITEDIFFSTYGKSEFSDTQTGCINKDGTCYGRIYKININKEIPQIVYQSSTTFTGSYYVKQKDNSIFLVDDKNNLLNINTNILGGKLIFKKQIDDNIKTLYSDVKILSPEEEGSYNYQEISQDYSIETSSDEDTIKIINRKNKNIIDTNIKAEGILGVLFYR